MFKKFFFISNKLLGLGKFLLFGENVLTSKNEQDFEVTKFFKFFINFLSWSIKKKFLNPNLFYKSFVSKFSE